MLKLRTRGLAVVSVIALAAVGAGACGSDAEPQAAAEKPTTTLAMKAETVVDVAVGNPEFSTLVTAVKAAGLVETLSGAGPFTVFAPTDAAFAKLPAGTVESLLEPANKEKLSAILTYHVAAGKVMASDVKPGPVKTVNGAEFTVSLEGGDVVLIDGQGNKAKVVTTDIAASNGVIHVIDAVLLPAG